MMIRWLSRALWGDNSDCALDFLPVQTDAKDWRAKAVKKARERHGKDFRAHTKVARETEPSRDLQELNAASNPQVIHAAAVVRKIKGT